MPSSSLQHPSLIQLAPRKTTECGDGLVKCGSPEETADSGQGRGQGWKQFLGRLTVCPALGPEHLYPPSSSLTPQSSSKMFYFTGEETDALRVVACPSSPRGRGGLIWFMLVRLCLDLLLLAQDFMSYISPFLRPATLHPMPLPLLLPFSVMPLSFPPHKTTLSIWQVLIILFFF